MIHLFRYYLDSYKYIYISLIFNKKNKRLVKFCYLIKKIFTISRFVNSREKKLRRDYKTYHYLPCCLSTNYRSIHEYCESQEARSSEVVRYRKNRDSVVHEYEEVLRCYASRAALSAND